MDRTPRPAHRAEYSLATVLRAVAPTRRPREPKHRARESADARFERDLRDAGYSVKDLTAALDGAR